MQRFFLHGLYVLNIESETSWMPKELVVDPDKCMVYLHRKLEEATLGKTISKAFRACYLFDNVEVIFLYFVCFFVFVIVQQCPI